MLEPAFNLQPAMFCEFVARLRIVTISATASIFWITTDVPVTTGVGVGGFGVSVGVAVFVGVGGLGVGLGVLVRVGVAVLVGVRVLVAVALGLADGSGVIVNVGARVGKTGASTIAKPGVEVSVARGDCETTTTERVGVLEGAKPTSADGSTAVGVLVGPTAGSNLSCGSALSSTRRGDGSSRNSSFSSATETVAVGTVAAIR